jgi:hypothetical protein
MAAAHTSDFKKLFVMQLLEHVGGHHGAQIL